MTDQNAIEIPINNGKAQSVSFNPDSGHLVGALTSGDLRQWKVDGGEVNPSIMRARGNVWAAVVSMDGRWIVSGDLGNKVIVWNAVTHQKAIEISDHSHYVYTLDVSSDSTRIASGSEDQTVRIFDIVSGSRIIPPLLDGPVIGVKYSPDGSRIATATYQYSFVGIFDASGNKVFQVSIQVTGAPVTPLAWSFDGKQLFIATSGKINHFDTSTSSLSDWSVHTGDNNTSIVSYGRFIACSANSSVSFWDCASHQQIGTIVTHASRVGCLTISHDGMYLACGTANGITIHSLSGLLPQAYLCDSRVSRIPLIQVSKTVLKSWMENDPTSTEKILSEEITDYSNPSHFALAARSLVRSRLGEWQTAIEDAELSLEIKQSSIGHIARSLALIGTGNQEVALDDFDLVFRDGDPNDNMLLLVVKSIFVFMCGKRKQAVSRLRGLIAAANDSRYSQVLVNMYLKQGDYENAVKLLEDANSKSAPDGSNPLMTISLIFNWNFDSLKDLAWQLRCQALYSSGCIKEVGETLEKMVGQLAEDEREPAHGRVLQEIVTRTGQVTLLMWTGKSSACNSCLPSSPTVYSQCPFAPSCLEGDELKRRTDEMQAVVPLNDALVIYGRITRLQPVRFAHFRLHLPCIVSRVTSLKKEQANVYHAETVGLGDVQFTTEDTLPLKEPRRLVFADLRVHTLQYPYGVTTPWEGIADAPVPNSELGVDVVYPPVIEEAPSAPPDLYTRALELIVLLRQPFSALLLLQQQDGAYKRVATDHEIVICGMGTSKDIHVEVLEIL